MQPTLEKELTKIERELIKDGREDFVREVRKASKEERELKLLGLAKHRQEIKNTKANDEKLIEAAERKKGLEAPYKEQLKYTEKMTRLVSLIMKDDGQE